MWRREVWRINAKDSERTDAYTVQYYTARWYKKYGGGIDVAG